MNVYPAFPFKMPSPEKVAKPPLVTEICEMLVLANFTGLVESPLLNVNVLPLPGVLTLNASVAREPLVIKKQPVHVR